MVESYVKTIHVFFFCIYLTKEWSPSKSLLSLEIQHCLKIINPSRLVRILLIVSCLRQSDSDLSGHMRFPHLTLPDCNSYWALSAYSESPVCISATMLRTYIHTRRHGTRRVCGFARTNIHLTATCRSDVCTRAPAHIYAPIYIQTRDIWNTACGIFTRIDLRLIFEPFRATRVSRNNQ